MKTLPPCDHDGCPPTRCTRTASDEAVVCKELFGSVYDLLVSIGGAHRLDKGIFVHNHSKEKPCDEWRFQGHLGFGGKYRRKTNRVDCYSEDETPERRAMIERLNAELAKLPNEKSSHAAGGKL